MVKRGACSQLERLERKVRKLQAEVAAKISSEKIADRLLMHPPPLACEGEVAELVQEQDKENNSPEEGNIYSLL